MFKYVSVSVNFFSNFKILLHVCMFCSLVWLYTMCMQCPGSPGEGVGSSGTEVKIGELPCCPLEKQPGLLTAKLGLQPRGFSSQKARLTYLKATQQHEEAIRKGASFIIALCFFSRTSWFLNFRMKLGEENFSCTIKLFFKKTLCISSC